MINRNLKTEKNRRRPDLVNQVGDGSHHLLLRTDISNNGYDDDKEQTTGSAAAPFFHDVFFTHIVVICDLN